MKEKKVSIIIPVYKVEAYLAECLESLIHQTYSNMEIILIDDESPDRCPEICDAYAGRDHRIQVIHKKNGGAGSARNAGLARSSGAYVCFVDSDDYVYPYYVEELVKALEEQEADIAAADYQCLYKDGVIPGNPPVSPLVCSQTDYLRQFLTNWNCSLIWNKIFRKDVLKDLKFVEGRRVDDEFFTYQAVMQARKIVQIDKCVYVYRMRASGVMNSGAACYEKMLDDRLAYQTERYVRVTEAYPLLKKAYLENLMDNFINLWRTSADYPSFREHIKEHIRNFRKEILFGPASVRTKYIFIRSIYLAKEKQSGKQQSENAGERRDLFD